MCGGGGEHKPGYVQDSVAYSKAEKFTWQLVPGYDSSGSKSILSQEASVVILFKIKNNCCCHHYKNNT